jgi:hypothetical protein
MQSTIRDRAPEARDDRDAAAPAWLGRIVRAVRGVAPAAPDRSLENVKFTDELERELARQTARTMYR